MKQHARLTLLLCLLAGAVFAQQTPTRDVPASKEDILRLFAVMNVQDQVRQTMDQIMQQMRAMNREQVKKRHPDITEEELAKMDQESEEMAKSFPVAELMDDMVPVYQKHLSKADVAAIIAFYSSPTGKKMLREMPAMMTEGMQAAYPRIQRSLDAIMKRMDANQQQTPAEKPTPENKQ
jgi:hypothetical protein